MSIKRLLSFMVLPLLLFGSSAMAQDKTVTGTVTDTAGNPLPNVSVVAKGTKAGASTSSNGTFSLKVPATATRLTITSVGFTAQDVAIGEGAINVTLRPSNASLSEVVVVGYGTARKKDLTGSVTTVSSRDFQRGSITTPEQLIAGKVPGVSIISNGGQPGSGSTIRIRGGSSLSASNDPLIVIDGVPLDKDGISGAGNALSFINPADIESFTVLKDASAAAIYGTRAANGVIIITTRKGKAGPMRINLNTTTSVSKATSMVKVLSADQVRNLVDQFGNAIQKSQVGTANTDWQKEIYRTAISSDNNLSISGGIKSLPYRVTLGYQYLNGILRTDRLQKTSLSLALNPVFLDNHLKVDINLKGSVEKTRFANQDAIGAALNFDPTQPVFSTDKRYGGYFQWRNPDGTLVLNRANNPVGLLEQTHDDQSPKRSIGNIQFDYKFHFLPDLHANLNLGYDVSKSTGTKFIEDSAATNYSTGGLSKPTKQAKTNTVFDFYLNYVKDLPSIRSRLDITAGYSYNNYRNKSYNFRDYNAKGDTIANTTAPDFAFDIPENTLLSYFSRLNYSFNDKYLLTATVRRDGSSRFSKENRWGTFPSVAVAWRMKGESFLKNSNVVSDLKLRVGYGVTGQQDGIGNYVYVTRYGLGSSYSSYPINGQYVQTYGAFGYNANLKWEQTATYNAALDYGFLNGRINGSLELYLKKTKDLVNNVPQAAGSSFGLYQISNVGSMENRGVEFSINAQPVRNRNLTWDVNFNITYNKNKITNLTVIPNDPTYIGLPAGTADAVNGFVFLNAVGGPKNTAYLYHQIYDNNGKPIEGLFEDVNRDGKITVEDKYKAKSADPNLFLGFSTNVGYKNWNAGFVLRANFNSYVYNNVYSNRGRLNQVLGAYTTGNASVNYLDTKFEGNNDLQTLSDYYLENASFLRMDNFSVGYNFGKIAHNKASLRLNGYVQNVFVITKYKGLDPEQNSGIDKTLYPRPRIYSLGVNLDF